MILVHVLAWIAIYCSAAMEEESYGSIVWCLVLAYKLR